VTVRISQSKINVGDIVFKKYHGGVRNGAPDKSDVGLVVQRYKDGEETDTWTSGAGLVVPQFRVTFSLSPNKRLWFYEHDLYKIESGS